MRSSRRLAERLTRRPGLLTAAICGLITVWAVVMNEFTSFAHEWMPHIAATAATIGLTVTIVEAILRREAYERFRPRRERVLSQILSSLTFYVRAVASDYAARHKHHLGWTTTDGTSAFLDLWLTEPSTAEDERRGPIMLAAAERLAEDLKQCREADLDVLPPNLVRAMDEFISDVDLARFAWGQAHSAYESFSPTTPDSDREFALLLPVRTAKRLVETLVRIYPSAEQMSSDIVGVFVASFVVARRYGQATRKGASPPGPAAST